MRLWGVLLSVVTVGCVRAPVPWLMVVQIVSRHVWPSEPVKVLKIEIAGGKMCRMYFS